MQAPVARLAIPALLLILLTPAAAPGAAAPPATAAPPDCAPTGHLISGATLNRDPAWQSSSLRAVTAVGPADVWAVGSYTPGGPQAPFAALIEHWNGGAWQPVASPAAASDGYRFPTLAALAASGPRDVWAVGGAYNDRDQTTRPLVEHWDGSAWSIRPAPPGAAGASLTLVAAPAPDDVWVAGANPSHWNGKTWQDTAIPLPPGARVAWAGLAAPARDTVWMAGTLFEADSARRLGGVLARWNGAAWQTQPVDQIPPNTTLTAMALAGARDIWLVGNTDLPTGPVPTAVPTIGPPGGGGPTPTPTDTNPLVFLRWDGAAWSRVPAPEHYFIRGLTFTGPSDGWASGAWSLDRQRFGLLHWDGARWKPVAVGDPPWYPEDLEALAVEGPGDIWAVGYGHIAGPIQRDQLSIAHIFSDCRVPTAPAPDPQDPAVTYFPPTRHTLRGLFRAYWQAHGGLAQFGYPITDEFPERNSTDGRVYTVQYFERNRFELHPENAGTPSQVLLGLLGRAALSGRPLELAFVPLRRPPVSGRFFSATGHTLAPQFAAYWEQHGGLAVFGYPISEPFSEVSPTDGQTYLTQYFERNRLEAHPELPPAFRVSLGLLGVDLLRTRGWLR
jgi:hypothetical protein